VSDWGLLDPVGDAGGLADDDALLAALVEVERALVAAMSRDDQDAARVAAVLSTSGLDRAALAEGARRDGVAVVELVRQLRAQAEAALAGDGELVHRGATSQDVLDTGIMLLAQRTVERTRAELVAGGDALARHAQAERDAPALARTLGQPAAPISIGATVGAWLDAATSALAELDAVTFPAQLGGAVGTGAGIDDVAAARSALAAELQLDDPGRSWHTDRAPVRRVAAASAGVVVALARVGTDLVTLSRAEVGEVVLAGAGASSAMPHKRNPVAAVRLIAAGVEAPALLATVVAGGVSSDARPAGAWHAELPALRSLLRLAAASAEIAADAFAGLRFDRDAAAANLAQGLPDAVPRAGLDAAGRTVDDAVARWHHVKEAGA
jgi:3-carboxy-cis,cis-muconate cycloisomerase